MDIAEQETLTPLRLLAAQMHETFVELTAVGFTEDQAVKIIGELARDDR